MQPLHTAVCLLQIAIYKLIYNIESLYLSNMLYCTSFDYVLQYKWCLSSRGRWWPSTRRWRYWIDQESLKFLNYLLSCISVWSSFTDSGLCWGIYLTRDTALPACSSSLCLDGECESDQISVLWRRLIIAEGEFPLYIIINNAALLKGM